MRILVLIAAFSASFCFGGEDLRSQFFSQFEGYWVSAATTGNGVYTEPILSIFIDGNGIHYFTASENSTKRFSYAGVSHNNNGLPLYNIRMDDTNEYCRIKFDKDILVIGQSTYARREDAPSPARMEYVKRARKALSITPVDVKLLGKSERLAQLEAEIALVKRDAIDMGEFLEGEDPNIAIHEANAVKFDGAGPAFAQDAANAREKARALRRDQENRRAQFIARKQKSLEAKNRLKELEAVKSELMDSIRTDISGGGKK